MIYHIRFFKSPTVNQKTQEISCVVTISNDLGEIFYYGNCEVLVNLYVTTGTGRILIDTSQHIWTPGMRAFTCTKSLNGLSTKARKPPKSSSLVLEVLVPQESAVDLLYDEETPRFIPLYSLEFSPTTQTDEQKVCARQMEFGLKIYEECQESIARHLWDAGITLVEHLAKGDTDLVAELDKFDIKSVLELGAGCGYVGLAFGHYYSAKKSAKLLLTDLPEAEAICSRNIEANRPLKSSSLKPEFKVADWEDENETLGHWDLILVSDCTYNPDSYEPLLKVIKRVMDSKSVLLLAHKHRHAKEASMFEMLEQAVQVKRKFRVDNNVDILVCVGSN